ncbi:MAG: hypothetical protein QG670_2426 [Thermoproteota archaeon]|nr:hypothetical protein [Thermoproteota archaeon]
MISKMGKSILNIQPVKADTIADIFNENGWKAIFNYLVNHFNLGHLNIVLKTPIRSLHQINAINMFFKVAV